MLGTHGDSVVMATVYVVMFGVTVYEYTQCGKHMYIQICKDYVSIRCHLETFQALSMNFRDSPRIFIKFNFIDMQIVAS